MVPEVVAEVVGPVSSKVEEDSRLGRYLSEHLGRGALKLPVLWLLTPGTRHVSSPVSIACQEPHRSRA